MTRQNHDAALVPDEVAEYIRARLYKETAGTRGPQSAIAAATGFSRAFVGYVRSGERGVTMAFARALAAYWSTTYEALEREARRYTGPPAPSHADTLPFGRQPGWSEARAEALRLYPTIPPRYIEQAADVVIPGMAVTHRAIQQVAMLRWDLDIQRSKK